MLSSQLQTSECFIPFPYLSSIIINYHLLKAKCLQSTKRFHSFYRIFNVRAAFALIKHQQHFVLKNYLHKKVPLLYLLMSFCSKRNHFFNCKFRFAKIKQKSFASIATMIWTKNYATLCWFKNLMDIPLI